MKLRSILSALLVSSILFTACNKDEEFGGIPTPQEGTETGYATIYLQQTPTGYSGVTRSSDDLDSQIKSIEFYVFNGNVRDTKAGVNGYVNINSTGGSNEFQFAVTAETNLTIITAVNMNLGEGSHVETLSAIKKALYNKEIETPTQLSTDGIPMTGETLNVFVGVEDVKRIPISVSRLYSQLTAPKKSGTFRVELDDEEIARLNEETQMNFTNDSEIKFDLEGYIVVNGLRKSFALPNYGLDDEYEKWLANIWNIGNDVTNYTESHYDDKLLGNVYSGDTFLTNETDIVYVYENSPVLKTSSGGYNYYDPATVYAYIIKAEMTQGTNEATRYWRINLAKTATHNGTNAALYQVLRNAAYNMSIGAVKTAGYNTPEEAEEDKEIIPDGDESGVIVTIEIADWKKFEENTDI